VTARGIVSKKHARAILKAKAAKDKADADLAAAMRAAVNDPDPSERASTRALAAFLGISKNTVTKILNGE
jgi:hypothetical protein